ncbi:MAG: MBL fold metallo-hydrolase [Candidatus Marinimicrobia bacterium]|nr:MBL fold metallo-hydrolase [Candidatus Neomarinimicrobiota bacterium]
MVKLKFMGATGTVTGSKTLLEVDNSRFLIDCGMFQGLKKLRLMNWEDFPIDVNTIDKIILTHAHIDHSGYIPRLVKYGFRKEIIATSTTTDLCRIMLLDSAHLQEEDAEYANFKKFSKHTPALPLYTSEDAQKAIGLFNPLPYGKTIKLADNIDVTFRDAGHILGSAFADIRVKIKGNERRILFTGDLGRPGQPILRDPHTVFGTDYLIIESTYGNRLHERNNIKERLAEVINQSADRGGILVVPSFAVGRTQTLLFYIRELEKEGKIPLLPVYIDSPMAIEATNIFRKHFEDYDLESKVLEIGGEDIFQTSNLHFMKTREQSVSLNKLKSNAIIISASGMVTGGRILHHLERLLPDEKNTVLFIGYQAEGTRGRLILDRAETVKIHGKHIPVRAKVENITGFSAHADYNEILAWLSNFYNPPKKVFIIHGEPDQSKALASRINAMFGWETIIPNYLDEFEIV